MFHELQSRDCEDGRATGQPQDVGPEAYLNGTPQGPTPEDARKHGHIRGRRLSMKHPGYTSKQLTACSSQKRLHRFFHIGEITFFIVMSETKWAASSLCYANPSLQGLQRLLPAEGCLLPAGRSALRSANYVIFPVNLSLASNTKLNSAGIKKTVKTVDKASPPTTTLPRPR